MLPLGKILRAEIVIQGHTPPAPDGPWQGVCPSHIMSHISHYIPGASWWQPRRRRCRSRNKPPWRPTCKRIYLFYQDKCKYIYRERERETKNIYLQRQKHLLRQRDLFILSRQKAKQIYIYIYIYMSREREKERK